MTKLAMTIAETVASKVDLCGVIGVRAEREQRKRLGRVAKSWNWPDGIRTTRLNGTCAIGLAYDYDSEYDDVAELASKMQANIDRYWKHLKKYGDYIYIVVGGSYKYGNDEFANEVIIKDCKAIGMI